MITTKQIQNILTKGEGISVEFKAGKAELPNSLFETICAFLNRNGGIILIGVADDKTVIGIDPDKAEKYCREIANLSNNPQKLSPSFLIEAQTITYKGKVLIHVYVPVSSQVHRCNDKIFDRTVDGDYEIKTSEQIKNLYARKNGSYSEGTIFPFLTARHFAPETVKKARTVIRIQRPAIPGTTFPTRNFSRHQVCIVQIWQQTAMALHLQRSYCSDVKKASRAPFPILK